MRKWHQPGCPCCQVDVPPACVMIDEQFNSSQEYARRWSFNGNYALTNGYVVLNGLDSHPTSGMSLPNRHITPPPTNVSDILWLYTRINFTGSNDAIIKVGDNFDWPLFEQPYIELGSPGAWHNFDTKYFGFGVFAMGDKVDWQTLTPGVLESWRQVRIGNPPAIWQRPPLTGEQYCIYDGLTMLNRSWTQCAQDFAGPLWSPLLFPGFGFFVWHGTVVVDSVFVEVRNDYEGAVQCPIDYGLVDQYWAPTTKPALWQVTIDNDPAKDYDGVYQLSRIGAISANIPYAWYADTGYQHPLYGYNLGVFVWARVRFDPGFEADRVTLFAALAWKYDIPTIGWNGWNVNWFWGFNNLGLSYAWHEHPFYGDQVFVTEDILGGLRLETDEDVIGLNEVAYATEIRPTF